VSRGRNVVWQRAVRVIAGQYVHVVEFIELVNQSSSVFVIEVRLHKIGFSRVLALEGLVLPAKHLVEDLLLMRCCW